MNFMNPSVSKSWNRQGINDEGRKAKKERERVNVGIKSYQLLSPTSHYTETVPIISEKR